MSTNKLQQNTVVLEVTFHSTSLQRKASLQQIELDGDKNSFRLNKEFIRSEHYKRLESIEWSVVKPTLSKYALPSPFKAGTYLMPIKCLDIVYPLLEKWREEFDASADALTAEWDQIIEDAKVRLGSQFNPKDYPPAKVMRGKFRMEWRLLQWSVPNESTLGEVFYEIERKKAEETWKEAEYEVSMALREGLAALVSHLVKQLEVGPEGAKKRIHESAVDKVNEFLDTFAKRNVLGDKDLAKLVEQAKQVLDNKSVEDIKSARESIGDQLKKVTNELTNLISSTKRVMSFDD